MRQNAGGLSRLDAVIEASAQVAYKLRRLPVAINTEIVTRLRSRGDNSVRLHRSPNSTSSVNVARPGASFAEVVPAVWWCLEAGPRVGAAAPRCTARRSPAQRPGVWRDAVNKRGGDVPLVDLPAVGIKGNTHFPMSDLNNVEVANHLAEFLQRKGLASNRQ